MALSENYRTETIGRSDCRLLVRLSADTIVRWDYRPNPNFYTASNLKDLFHNIHPKRIISFVHAIGLTNKLQISSGMI